VSTALVVCHGNICRSPFAAALLRRAWSRSRIRVDSAGFLGPGRPPPAEAVAVGARYGLDLSAHRSQLLTAERVRAADLIVVMDVAQQRAVCNRFGRAERDVLILGDLDPRPVGTRAIRDPVNQPSEAFEDAYARIERCIEELVRATREVRAT
jgi:protein-tyrosine phosphatase